MGSSKTKSPYLLKKKIVNGTKTVGYVLENRGKEYQVSKDELVKLAENYPNQVQVDLKNKSKEPVYLTVIEEIEKDSHILATPGEPKKVLKTISDNKVKNNLKELKSIKATTGAKLKEFKTPEKELIPA